MTLRTKIVLIIAGIFVAAALLSYPAYRIGQKVFETHFQKWGEKLVDLEKRGLLSTEFGAAWQDILTDEAMQNRAQGITSGADDTTDEGQGIKMVDGIAVENYPSLSLVRRLNEIHTYSNTIEILDRYQKEIALIRTDHTRGKIDEFPRTLKKALIAAEDGDFYSNENGFSYRSFVRASLLAMWRSITSFRIVTPRGVSTITQQVAKLFISDVDKEGRRRVERSIDRKLREMHIAAALRDMYTPDEILEVYFNHCVTSDYGLIGFKDIARGLFNKEPRELTDAECIYLSRMVKWGRNIKSKITQQCRIDMPRIAEALKWDTQKQQTILSQIDSITFTKPRRIETNHGMLIDCANVFWQKVLRKNGMSSQETEDMDIVNPNSLIRKKGNLSIQLTIDLRIQKELEKLVDSRGYGGDTVITTDARIGSFGENVRLSLPPRDTLRNITIMQQDTVFSEPGKDYATTLYKGDTLITNIRYRSLGGNAYRRSQFFYTRAPIKIDGQYFAYCVLDSKTGELLAYYSRDRIGSRLAALMRNRTPNGSSTAKPIFNALNFDQGIFAPYEKWDDTQLPPKKVPWERSFQYNGKKPIGVKFHKSAVRGQPYLVHNHGHIFENCQYIFDHLSSSNNILGAETCYRLDTRLFDSKGDLLPSALPMAQFFSRIGCFERVKKELKLKTVTGVRVYKELARIVGVNIDSMMAYGRKIPISDSLYSVSLGTLELTLLEQAHLFNLFYNNTIYENPASHPSLFISSITLNEKVIPIHDTIRQYHPLNDINTIRPTYLGMHKRLTSNKWDRLDDYDIAYSQPQQFGSAEDSVFDSERFYLEEPISNYAKSGTTDDVIRPFNVDVTSKKRTNFGLWNAVIRINAAKLEKGTNSIPEFKDITIACIGECNRAYTGPRDGKTLHKFVTKGFLEKAGVKAPEGFFTQYEQYLKKVTPDSVQNCGKDTMAIADN